LHQTNIGKAHRKWLRKILTLEEYGNWLSEPNVVPNITFNDDIDSNTNNNEGANNYVHVYHNEVMNDFIKSLYANR